MMKTLLLICSLNTNIADCRQDTALAVIPLPKENSLLACMMHGQAMAAEADAVGPDRYIKVICGDETAKEK